MQVAVAAEKQRELTCSDVIARRKRPVRLAQSSAVRRRTRHGNGIAGLVGG